VTIHHIKSAKHWKSRCTQSLYEARLTFFLDLNQQQKGQHPSITSTLNHVQLYPHPIYFQPIMNALFGKKLTPKEQAMKAKRETRKEVRVSECVR
jgi:hypothetical protein